MSIDIFSSLMPASVMPGLAYVFYIIQRDIQCNVTSNYSYLLIRGFHDREEVLEARLRTLKAIKNLGPHRLDEDHPWEDGVLDVRCGHDSIPSFQVRAKQGTSAPCGLDNVHRREVGDSEHVIVTLPPSFLVEAWPETTAVRSPVRLSCYSYRLY